MRKIHFYSNKLIFCVFYHSNSHQLDGFCSNSFISCNLQIFFPLFVLFFSAECRINTEKLFHLCCKRIYAKTVVSDKHKQKLWMQMKANQVGKKTQLYRTTAIVWKCMKLGFGNVVKPNADKGERNRIRIRTSKSHKCKSMPKIHWHRESYANWHTK